MREISSRHFAMNSSRSHSWSGFRYFRSTVRSMLIPFRSSPIGKRTAFPSIRWALATMSIREYPTTAPGCQSPLGYGGGVSITNVGPRSGLNAYRAGSAAHAAMSSFSTARSHCFPFNFGSAMGGAAS